MLISKQDGLLFADYMPDSTPFLSSAYPPPPPRTWRFNKVSHKSILTTSIKNLCSLQLTPSWKYFFKKRPVLNFFSKFPSDQLFLPCHLLRLPHLLMFPLLSVNISSRISCPQLLKTKYSNSAFLLCSQGYCDIDYPFPLKTSKISTLPFVLSLDTNKIKFSISSKNFPKCLMDSGEQHWFWLQEICS